MILFIEAFRMSTKYELRRCLCVRERLFKAIYLLRMEKYYVY